MRYRFLIPFTHPLQRQSEVTLLLPGVSLIVGSISNPPGVNA